MPCDLSLVVTVYEPYENLLEGMLEALDVHWPEHPVPIVSHGDQRLHMRMIAALKLVSTPFAIILHEDYHLCQEVKQDLIDACMSLMRNDADVLSCSLTYEPIAKTPYKQTFFQELPVDRPDWPYAIGFQARVWRVQHLLQILQGIAPETPHADFEPTCSRFFARHMHPALHAITYPMPPPPIVDPHVDSNDKSQWIVGYL